jgi:ankyrin repeat protein
MKMRLLEHRNTSRLSLKEFPHDKLPRYAILSHTWGEEEVTFREMMDGEGKDKLGYQKLVFCGNQAWKDGLQYFWVDTCCIDKSSSAELQTSIDYMFRWYCGAAKCYVYLSDVSTRKRMADKLTTAPWEPVFRNSRWFTRGWTLQELLAPTTVIFYSRDGEELGTKEMLEQLIHDITRIPINALRHYLLSSFSIAERLTWAKHRQTTHPEDKVYSLFGIFDVQMPLLYGEGEDRAYRRLLEEISKASRNGNAQLEASYTGVASSLHIQEQKQQLLDSLRFEQMDARQINIKRAHAKTCKWLLHKSEYVDWLDVDKLSQHHGILWIKGKPGAGKSTLMKFILTDARVKMKDTIIISFFFNARGHDLERSTLGMYRSLVLQLLERLPMLQDVARLALTGRTHLSQWTVESLKSLFEHVVQHLGGSPLVCFIDALDECDEGEIRDMISFFDSLGELLIPAGIPYRVCFSSRHYPHIKGPRAALSLTLEGQEGHNQDISSYLDSELDIGCSNLANQIRSDLQEKASGVFMWIVLVVGILNKEHDHGRIHTLRQKIRSIPGDLHALFRDILTRDGHNRGELVLCLQWVLFAKQPLKPAQLYYAIHSGIEPEALAERTDDITAHDMERYILSSSKGLTEVTKSGQPTVQFIHESVKDFLLKENGLMGVWADVGSNFEGASHDRLKQCCLRCMSIIDLASHGISAPLPTASSQEAAELRQRATMKFPFLEYAARNVLYHADAAEKGGISQTGFLETFQLADWIQLDNFFEWRPEKRYTWAASFLYIVSDRNLAALIRVLPFRRSCFDAEDELLGPPIYAALAAGSADAVNALIETHSTRRPWTPLLRDLGRQFAISLNKYSMTGHSFIFSRRNYSILSLAVAQHNEDSLAFLISAGYENSKDTWSRTPLWWAADKGYESIARTLIDTGKVDIDAKDSYGTTPLSQAAMTGHTAIVRMLLDTGKVCVDSTDKNGRSPLCLAAAYGHDAIMQLLMDIGNADINMEDGVGRTPLSLAALGGHTTAARLLLDTGKVCVDSTDKNGSTPLWSAAARGHEATMRLLIDVGKADINIEDDLGRTPLSLAAIGGHTTVVRMLLDTGKAHVDSKDKRGRSPLEWAAWMGHEAIVRLLLDTGKADLSTEKDGGRAILSQAATGGHGAVVQLLLDTGKVDIDSDGKASLLWWAAKKGYKDVTRVLLDTGKVDITSKDMGGRTAMSYAAEGGHEVVARMLLNAGDVHVNSEDSSGRTALSYAVMSGGKAMVRLLLNTGKADVTLEDRDGRTALSHAAEGGHEVIARMLLDTDKVHVNSKDVGGKSALSYAAMNGHATVVSLLLGTADVDMDSKDLDGRTPLSWAVNGGHKAVIRMLLNTIHASLTNY